MKRYSILVLLIFPFLFHSQNETQEIQLEVGWSLFSTYITTEDNNIENIFSDIIEDVIIIKDENGNVYWPEFDLNSIIEFEIGKAYQIKMENSNNLIITGSIVDCTSPIELIQGWNFIGYLNTSPTDIEQQFLDINNIIIIKDDSGNVYWPFYSINSIQELNPGEGYQIKLNDDITFNYLCEMDCIEYDYFCDGGTWQNEIYWEIQNEFENVILSGGAPEEGSVCLEDGCYTIFTSDIYGDGWQDNILNIGGLIFTNENLDGCSNCGLETQSFELCIPFEITLGCLDPNAVNYNENANTNDDSCIYPESSLNMNLVSIFDYDEIINDIWGYAAGNSEYALVGTNEGFSVVDITLPEQPTELFFIEGDETIWRDIKTWQNYVYVVCDNCDDGLLIVDLNDLSGQTFSFTTEFFEKAHNIFIDENGYLYVFGGNPFGFIILNLNDNPMSPTYEGTNDTYYLHDGMVRGDTVWGASTQEGEFIIYDVTDKASPSIMSSQPTPGGITHNCWISNDGNTLFTTQEYSGGYIRAYDVSNIYDISMTDEIQSWSGFANVVPHNTHVIGDFLVTSYYTDGITIIDATDPYNLVEIGYYDTSTAYEGDGYYGCWGAYPYLPSGLILATDRQNGLHILDTEFNLIND